MTWDEPEDDLKEEYLFYFNNFRKLIATAAAGKQALLVSLT